MTTNSLLLGKLRVIEGFIGSVIRWHEQPGVNLKSEMHYVETATHEALRLLGAEPSKPAETKPLANYHSPTLDAFILKAWHEAEVEPDPLARAKAFLTRLQAGE